MKLIYKPNLLAAALVGMVAFTATIAQAADRYERETTTSTQRMND